MRPTFLLMAERVLPSNQSKWFKRSANENGAPFFLRIKSAKLERGTFQVPSYMQMRGDRVRLPGWDLMSALHSLRID